MLGGGYIAVEFAGIFAGLGAEVDLVYRQPLPLRGFDDDLRAALAEAHGGRRHPPASLHHHRLRRAERAGRSWWRCRNGTVLPADLVFTAIGRLPNTAGLGLERAGVDHRRVRRGARARPGRRPARRNIFAIGDVTNRLNLTPVAIAEGHSLAESLFGAGSARLGARYRGRPRCFPPRRSPRWD